MRRKRKLATGAGLALLLAAALPLGSQEVTAADHADSDAASANAAADIADLYAWHTENGTVVAIITFAGLQAAGDPEAYDRDVLYTLHIDNTATAAGLTTNADPLPSDNSNDNESDIQVHIRFGQNFEGAWGFQVENLPGADPVVQAQVGETIDAGSGVMATAGTFDDPFFFDLDGFTTTLINTADATEAFDLAFASLDPNGNGPVDAFAGTNVHAIVLEFDAATAIGDGEGLLQLWATTGVIR